MRADAGKHRARQQQQLQHPPFQQMLQIHVLQPTRAHRPG
jgi:hypothetical protein